jgi:hypothetical protein
MVLVDSLAAVYGGLYAGTAALTVGLGYWVLDRTEMGSRRWFGVSHPVARHHRAHDA